MVTAVAYAGSLSGGYVYEDQNLRPWPTTRVAIVDTFHRPARSLSAWVRWLTARVSDTGPAARTVSLSWHLLNSLLVWTLARRVASEGAALVALAIFALHPLQTESVAYIAAQPELIAASTLLVGLWCVSTDRLWLAALCGCLAIAGKEFAVTDLLLLPLWAWWTGKQWSHVAQTVWLSLVAALAVVGIGALQVRGIEGPTFGSSLPYIAGQLTELWRLLALLPEALVHPSALTIDHDWTWITRPMAYGAAALWIVALLATAWRRCPVWGFALLWTLVALSPRLLLPLPDGLHEHYLYTPMIAISLAIGAACVPASEIA